MRGRPSPVDALVTLPDLAEAQERRTRWRQAVASLGQQTTIERPPLLDGVDPKALSRACRIALDTGLTDDLDWIGAGPAGVALYELTTALPHGPERSEFGRRVFSRLYGGPAGAFVSVATRMAWNSVKQLESPTMRARVSLAFSLPIGSSVNADPLALALVMRPQHFQSWVANNSTGPLPARRLAAVIFERAARECVLRAQGGDNYPARYLLSDAARPIYERLLLDREPLVWRHAAVARGLLSSVETSLREEIELMLDPTLSPTEWRRAAVSLVACLSHDADTVLSQCRSVVHGELARKHPPLLSTLLWGLPPVVESDPEIAEALLMDLAQCQRPDVAKALIVLAREVIHTGFAEEAMSVMRSGLKLQKAGAADDSLVDSAIWRSQESFGSDPSENATVYSLVRCSMVAYETSGAFAARELAEEALERAHHIMSRVEAETPEQTSSLLRVLPLVEDLDVSALQRARLSDLLLLDRSPGDQNTAVVQLDDLFDRLGEWILRSEQSQSADTEWTPSLANARRQKLVTYLHLLDVQTSQRGSKKAAQAVRKRIGSSVQTLLKHIARGPDPAVHRVMCAALARSFDAAIREQVAEPSDLLQVVIDHLQDPSSIRTLMEASTDHDMREGLHAYSDFLSLVYDEPSDDQATYGSPEAALASGFVDLSNSVGLHGSYRGEALRQCTLRIGRYLEAVVAARGITDLVPPDSTRHNFLEDLERSLDGFRALVATATRRVMSVQNRHSISEDSEPKSLARLFGRAALSGQRPPQASVSAAIDELISGLPASVETALRQVLLRLADLPLTPPDDVSVIPLKSRRTALPGWLFPRRTIGGFFVTRALGSGGVSTVFVAKRIEDRRDPNADCFALKVPQFDPTTARSLSEQEFMEMFRDEAGALLSLPKHDNLARFVNFDMSAKPKPILVMELIRGQSLENLIANRALTLASSLEYLQGILAGVIAMHSVGVAHLDLKPSNVILRDEHTAVLVDFGLSGRQLRPGCGTLEYCAPEILGVVPKGFTPAAPQADIYAFACTAYEILTAQLLFDADNEVALMSQHVSHDGWPQPLADLAHSQELKDVVVILAACLRRDPRDRPTAEQTLAALNKSVGTLAASGVAWPLGQPEQAVG